MHPNLPNRFWDNDPKIRDPYHISDDQEIAEMMEEERLTKEEEIYILKLRLDEYEEK